MEKVFNQKNFHYFFWTHLGSRVSIKKIFFFKSILSCQHFDNCSHCLPPALLKPVANLSPVSLTTVVKLPPVSTTLAKLVEKFAAGVIDSGSKFASGVDEMIPVVHLDLLIYLRIFEKI
jgi:hypothetical protein